MKYAAITLIIILSSTLFDYAYAYTIHKPPCLDHLDARKPDRFVVHNLCQHVEGKVMRVMHEKDGDYHIALQVYGNDTIILLNSVNKSKFHGFLVTEIEPREQKAGIQKPLKGWCVAIDGPWVLDKEHGWNELHPVKQMVHIACVHSQDLASHAHHNGMFYK